MTILAASEAARQIKQNKQAELDKSIGLLISQVVENRGEVTIRSNSGFYDHRIIFNNLEQVTAELTTLGYKVSAVDSVVPIARTTYKRVDTKFLFFITGFETQMKDETTTAIVKSLTISLPEGMI